MNIYLQTMVVGNYAFTMAQQNLLFGIASQCPQVGGDAVHMARSLYASVDPEIDFHVDDCRMEIEPRIWKKEGYMDSPGPVLFPNPANDLLHLEITGDNEFGGEIRIYNLLGEVVVRRAKLPEEKRFSINVRSLKQGIYQVQILKNGKLEFNTVFSVIR